MYDSNRKGKLARCWLAATFSEKMFKKTCKPALIKKINVSYICNEILSTVEIRNDKNYGRFSLYLSSQLMYGATKILFYQTKYFQDYLFEVNWKLHEINRYKEELNAVMSLELPEIPPISEVFRNLEMSSNLHLITEEPYSSAIENLIQSEMNFGALPTHEMEKFILSGVEELSLNEIRRFHWDQSIEIPNESIQVPLLDVNKFEIETEKETRLASTGRDQPESFFIFENHHIKKNIPVTPKKRTSKSPIEIPIKRRKITSAEELPAIELFSAPITENIHASDLPSELQKEVFPEFQNIELNKIKTTKKKKTYLDKQTKLTDTIMRRYIENVYAHTIKEFRFTTILPSAKDYLKQPSMKINNKSWGKTLIEFFNQYFKKPLIVQNEFQNMFDFKMKETIVGETIRADDSSRLRDQINELSSKIMIATTETNDISKTLDKILPIESIEVKEFEEQTKEIKESEAVLISEITSFEEKISSKTYLTKRELLALMIIYWNEGILIKFHDLISPECYNKTDAACAFQYCLEFHAEKIVILKQAEPFDTIWIEKYPYYALQNGENYNYENYS